MHVQSASHYEFWYNFIVVLGIFLGPLASMITTIGTAVNSRPVNIFDILSSIISFVSGVAVGILKFGKYDQVSTNHRNAAVQYSALERTIRRYKWVPTETRDPFHEFSKFIGDSLDALLKQSPAVPSQVISRYISMAKKLNIAIPSEINIDYENTFQGQNSVSSNENTLQERRRCAPQIQHKNRSRSFSLTVESSLPLRPTPLSPASAPNKQNEQREVHEYSSLQVARTVPRDPLDPFTYQTQTNNFPDNKKTIKFIQQLEADPDSQAITTFDEERIAYEISRLSKPYS